jgi:hypothetical protein
LTNKGIRQPETVIALPDLGSVTWTCKDGPTPSEVLFSTMFTASRATETVGYSLGGAAAVSKRLEPGQAFSTPFTPATSQVWTVDQPVEPWDSKATITVVLKPDPVVGCFNPTVTVSRVRVSNARP